MATHLKSLSEYQTADIDISSKKFVLVVSVYNEDITHALLEAAVSTLQKEGAQEQNIAIKYVPGAYELSLGAQMAAAQPEIDAVICLGCVIQGETKHFDFICSAVAHGLTSVALKYNKPVVFGVLTPNNLEQAQARAGGIHGNKGVEAAVTAIQMLGF